ncbi:MAG: nucleotidyl transferase AbiEii/AbiGii toxin family protein [Ignavibacteriales bacterium]|nr:nucleotidyl transferase AbiEii/AbiGii toxin family protein [Ignavibacteriales bacterium]
MTYLKDISNRVEPAVVKVLTDLAEITSRHRISFLVVGATARDIVFSAIHNIPTRRASLDIDLGIRIETWEQFETVVNDLVDLKSYDKDSKKKQRLYVSGTIVDIVPFGPLENPVGIIAWPPTSDVLMRTDGFEEALQSSIAVRVSVEPEVVVKVCTPAALAVMKLCSWKDAYPERKKDAVDLRYILTKYIDAGNEDRFYTSDDDLFAAKLDYDLVSARLLGRDAGDICTETTLVRIINILNEELARESALRLLADMVGDRSYDEQMPEFVFQSLKQFKTGIEEDRNRKAMNS